MSSRKYTNPLMNKITLISALILGGIFILMCSVQKSWGNISESLCVFYAVATFLFFAAQLVGFVVAQSDYSENIESPKFSMLENEEKEWAGF